MTGWNLNPGKVLDNSDCQKTPYIGQEDSFLYLSYHNQLLLSGADQSTCVQDRFSSLIASIVMTDFHRILIIQTGRVESGLFIPLR